LAGEEKISENRIRKTNTVQAHGPASAGIWSSLVGLLQFNPAGTVKTMVDTDTAQVLTNKTIYPTFGAALTADGAIPVPTVPTLTYITKAGVCALTLAAPTADGIELEVKSTTAHAHTITATGLLESGSAAVNVATFAAFAGAGVRLRGRGSKWQVVSSVGITFS